MGRPAKFTRAELEDAAIAVLDERGVAGLTIRAVAGKLGTGPMTLYNYIDDRGELDALVVDGVLRDVTLPRSPSPDWRTDVHQIAEQVRSAVREHPNAIPLVLARRSHAEIFLDIAEALLSALARSGLRGGELLAAFRAVTTLATAFPLTELTGQLSVRGGGPHAIIDRFRSLPTQRYPRLVEVAEAARASTPEAEFGRGLDALLDGLQTG
jgi:AcrR family transcriptional regulator